MSAERLFRTNTGSKAPSVQPTLSVAEAEDLFDALAILQNVGSSGPAGVLRLGKAFDVSVDKFFSLVRFRQLMDRTASCPNDFFQRLDLDKSQSLSLSEIARFIQNPRNSEERQDPSGTDAGASGADPSKLAELVFSALDANRDGKIESWEFQQQLALAAPPRLSLVALTAHLEMKHGFGQSGLHGPVDRALLFEYLCNREALDLAPEDVARCLRVARSSSAAGKRGPPAQDADLEGTDVDAFLRILPVDAVWGLDPYIDQYYAALGTRVLMLERPRRGDACVPREALLEHREKAPDEAELRARFGQLWDAAALMGSAKEIKDAGIGRVHEEIREGCFKRYAAAAAAVMEWRAARMQEAGGRFLARHFAGPRSLFFNIGDVLATPSHRLYAGQACVVRFRLHGGASFWHPQHQVLKNEREPTAWPLQQQALGDTPFVGLVPRGLKFTTAGGGGFYLGKQPFSMVDPNLRADLPRDEASGALAHSGCVEITMPSLLRSGVQSGP
ncbi:unnamed protein product [Prorocentrum cordatum]|uniref:EF-hand domain-containing protein n=1 Tax=Prorocentrum cordatum TaxID=2364126 RepID=A0ABN9V6W9_9DINO|nr:unnamed protein product [Polarella glacialis]